MSYGLGEATSIAWEAELGMGSSLQRWAALQHIALLLMAREGKRRASACPRWKVSMVEGWAAILPLALASARLS